MTIYRANDIEEGFACDIDDRKAYTAGLKCTAKGHFIYLGYKRSIEYVYGPYEPNVDDIAEIDEAIKWLIEQKILSCRKDMLEFYSETNLESPVYRIDTLNNIYLLRLINNKSANEFSIYCYDRQLFTLSQMEANRIYY